MPGSMYAPACKSSSDKNYVPDLEKIPWSNINSVDFFVNFYRHFYASVCLCIIFVHFT